MCPRRKRCRTSFMQTGLGSEPRWQGQVATRYKRLYKENVWEAFWRDQGGGLGAWVGVKQGFCPGRVGDGTPAFPDPRQQVSEATRGGPTASIPHTHGCPAAAAQHRIRAAPPLTSARGHLISTWMHWSRDQPWSSAAGRRWRQPRLLPLAFCFLLILGIGDGGSSSGGGGGSGSGSGSSSSGGTNSRSSTYGGGGDHEEVLQQQDSSGRQLAALRVGGGRLRARLLRPRPQAALPAPPPSAARFRHDLLIYNRVAKTGEPVCGPPAVATSSWGCSCRGCCSAGSKCKEKRPAPAARAWLPLTDAVHPHAYVHVLYVQAAPRGSTSSPSCPSATTSGPYTGRCRRWGRRS